MVWMKAPFTDQDRFNIGHASLITYGECDISEGLPLAVNVGNKMQLSVIVRVH